MLLVQKGVICSNEIFDGVFNLFATFVLAFIKIPGEFKNAAVPFPSLLYQKPLQLRLILKDLPDRSCLMGYLLSK